jgi:hypothetical protein
MATIKKTRNHFASIFVFAILLGTAFSQPELAITPITWNVIGLDSNDVSVGPDTFIAGARVHNIGDATATNVVSNFVWDSDNPYLNLTGPSTFSILSLAPGERVDLYYNVVVTRTTAAYNTARRYHITATADGLATITTPVPRELYVEELVSRGSNRIYSISGPTSVRVGQSYEFIMDSSTTPNHYKQLETFISFPNTMFRVVSTEVSYSVPAGLTSDILYADACGWDPDPNSPTYLSCVGPCNYEGCKAGGEVVTRYTVEVIAPGTATLYGVIRDFSGSTYHYNSDFAVYVFNIIIETPTPTPTPTPWRIIYDFIPDQEGWTTGGAPVVYALPDFAWETDYLKTTSQTNTNTFGYWQSPPNAIPVDADHLYRARFNVSTDITDRARVPQLRVRANSSNFQQYDVLSIKSAGEGGMSPQPTGTDYDLYFVPPGNDSAATLAFDLLNFNPYDAPVAELALDTVIVERFALDSLSAPTLVQDYTFDVSTDGWITGGAPIAFSAPQYRHAGGALELRALTNTNTFGYWVNNPADITIETDRLYRGTFVVRTDVTNPALVPEMRVRFNTGNFQASQSFGITSAGDGANSPGTMNTVYDRLYFLPPANCIGNSLIVSFDILNFNPNDAAEASLILDHAIIESLEPPGLP